MTGFVWGHNPRVNDDKSYGCTFDGCEWTTSRLVPDLEAGRSFELHHSVGACVCDTGPNSDGPEETCPQHGRGHDYWLERSDVLQGRINAVAYLCGSAPGVCVRVEDLLQALDMVAAPSPTPPIEWTATTEPCPLCREKERTEP